MHAHHLVTHETAQVSVDNRGMVRLPMLTRPQEVDDLIEALRAAQEVGLAQQALNQAAQTTEETPPPGRAPRRSIEPVASK